MAKFNRDNYSGGNRSFGKPRFRSDRPDMHKATCAHCGKICTVPFKPTGSKPVYCKDCFQSNQNSETRRPERRTYDRPSFGSDENRNRANEAPNYKAQFEALNEKMDRILDLLTQNSVDNSPLESVIDEKAIEEIAEEVQEAKEERVDKKQKKAKTRTTNKTKE